MAICQAFRRERIPPDRNYLSMGSRKAKIKSTRLEFNKITKRTKTRSRKMELKQRILEEQVKRKLSNKQMAELLEVNNTTYWRYKKGFTDNLRDTQKIIEKLGIKFA